jgi:hypothetical protein
VANDTKVLTHTWASVHLAFLMTLLAANYENTSEKDPCVPKEGINALLKNIRLSPRLLLGQADLLSGQ